jgi:hypothetical protein
MAYKLAAALPRFALLAIGFLLATATLTYAASKTIVPSSPAAKATAAAEPVVLVVPQVRGQAYVFAKGILEDAGFAWRVAGPVKGYAPNTVVAQEPAAGTRVLDSGAPELVLRLVDNPAYANEGSPENASPYRGTPLRLFRPTVPARAKPAVKAPAKPKAPAAPKTPVAPKPKPAPAAPKRPPAFAVPGAPREPLGEPPLTARAKALERWLAQHPRPTDANVRHFLYQHAWVVTGARFGWWRGEEALRVLLRVDRRAKRVWGIGGRNERVAMAALEFVLVKEQ